VSMCCSASQYGLCRALRRQLGTQGLPTRLQWPRILTLLQLRRETLSTPGIPMNPGLIALLWACMDPTFVQLGVIGSTTLDTVTSSSPGNTVSFFSPINAIKREVAYVGFSTIGGIASIWNPTITEMNGICPVLFGMNNRIFGLYLAAIHRNLISVTYGPIALQRCSGALRAVIHLSQAS
jgi:hypothetical protein